LYGARACQFTDAFLERFFKHFPEQSGLEQFTIADVTDYRQWRLDEGCSKSALMSELNVVKRFWRWLIEEKQLPLFNPAASLKPSNPAKTFWQLKLQDFKALLFEIEDRRIREYVLGLVVGENRDVGVSPGVIGRTVREAGKRAGMPWMKLYTLRIAIKNTLWREIIKENYEKLSDSLIPEPKPASDTLTNVEVPTSDIRPSVIDSSDNSLVVSGVPQL
jgi:hypothetical protein